MVNLFIAIPTYGGVAPEHVSAVHALTAWLHGQGIAHRVVHHNMTEIARSRNILATRFLEQDGPTHMLFVDSDMEFEPAAVAALIACGKPLVGAVYPKRAIDLDRLIAAARRLDDRAQIIASALDFVVVPDGDAVAVENGLVRVAALGMGLCLIARAVFDTLEAKADIRTSPPSKATAGPVRGFFDPVPSPTGMMSEDVSFCHRWRTECGGEVWGLIDHEIGHVGAMSFRARLIDAFLAQAATPG